MGAAKNKDLLTQRIRESCPELQLSSVRQIGAGQYNDVLVVNEQWIFRFPRFAEGIRSLEIEIAILRGIRSAVSLEVPEPVFTAFEPSTVGCVFAGYRMLGGEPLLRERLAQIDDEATLDQLAAQLGGFLRELHSISAQDAIHSELPSPGPVEPWSNLYRRIQIELFPLMAAESRGRASALFETFLADPFNVAVQPVLVHGDFGGSNILFDPEYGAISGVIDFGSAHLGDAALDLAALATYGEPFLQRIAASYPLDEALTRRARFYLGTFALQEALYGVEHDDPAAFKRGIAAYR